MRCVVLQPSYIPWRGYFEQIHRADLFVFYDCVQYDRRGWRNRNRIKTHTGPQWLTIPVFGKNTRVDATAIKDIQIVWDRPWNKKHWNTIRTSYAKAPFFSKYEDLLGELYSRNATFLADYTIEFTLALAKELGISGTTFMRSSEVAAEGTKTDRLLSILREVGATEYLSGPSARGYLDEPKLEAADITVTYMDYDYPDYPQLYPPFDPKISVLDLLFMTGPDALKFIRSPQMSQGAGASQSEVEPSINEGPRFNK